jgi:predicted negative regulator of RcsB-dependent stress response
MKALIIVVVLVLIALIGFGQYVSVQATRWLRRIRR